MKLLDEFEEAPPAVKRSMLKKLFIGVGILLLLVCIVLGGAAWYVSTAGFQEKVRLEIVNLLEETTGGRVELGSLRISLWHLDVVAQNLVIHGLEGPGEAPYLEADRIEVRLKIKSLLAYSSGAHIVNNGSLAAHIALNLLKVDAPKAHLIVNKDGSTNAPTPKTKSKPSDKPITDTLLDLQAEDVEVLNGVIVLNDRTTPFNLMAQALDVGIGYHTVLDYYDIQLGLSDLRTKMKTEPEISSRLSAEMTLGRKVAEVKRFEFDTGKASKLLATGKLENYAHPVWTAAVQGTLELKQMWMLGAIDGNGWGAVDLKLDARSCAAAEIAEAKKKPSRLGGPAMQEMTAAQWNRCDGEYLAVGGVTFHRVAYQDPDVRVHDVNGGTKIRITPDVMEFTEINAILPYGGNVTGGMRMENWSKMGTTPVQKPHMMTEKDPEIVPIASGISHSYIDATVNGAPLRTIMDFTAPKDYGDLGFDTAVTGPVHVEFSNGYGETTIVDGDLKFAPTGIKKKGALSDIPVTGYTVAKYRGGNMTVAIADIHLQTPGSTLDAGGILGVDEGDPLTNLHTDLTVRDLGEFDQLFRTLGLEAGGKKGTDAIPVVLHGDMRFHGTATGPIALLDVKGHMEAENVEAILPDTSTPVVPKERPLTKKFQGLFPTAPKPVVVDTTPAPAKTRTIMVDSVVADADYSPAGLKVATSTIKRGTVTLNLGGTAYPEKVMAKGVPDYLWNEHTAVDASIAMADAKVTDVLQVVGMNADVTGMIQAHAHVTGTLDNLNGQGNVALRDGVVYGEPYQRISADMDVKGQDVAVSNAMVQMHNMQIAGSGDYDMESKHLRGHVAGENLKLAQFQTVAAMKVPVDGVLTLHADADGTLEQPGLHADVKLANLMLGNQQMGALEAQLHSERDLVYFTTTSDLLNAKLNASGQVQLTGDYQAQAKLSFSQLDVYPLMRLYAPKNISGHSVIAGDVTLHGPLAEPKNLSGEASINQFDVKIVNVELHAPQPLRFTLQNGLLGVDHAHITGTDTDLHANGTAQVLGVTSPKGGAMNMHADGGISMTLAQTFDPDILASGKVQFTMDAAGTVTSPALTGKVQFINVGLALEDVPNGLSQMNGTLVFNQDRLQVDTLTATTGGGQLKIGGFMTYKNGFYADMTATGDNVRVRYNGLSATANANLRLQGASSSALLSGTILITRFGIGQDVDFAAFAGAPGALSAPPDPDAPSSHIRLDVKVTSSPQLDFQNSYAKLAGTVDLNIGGTVAAPTVLGRITVTEGSATFAGQQYQLQRGSIYFTNPVRIDPQIDLDATTRVENYDVTIGVHGTSSNLKPTYRSEPPLSETDIFALLALGRTQEEAQIYQTQQVAQGTDPTTSALLGGALNATVSNRVEKLFGVGSVKIDPSFVGTLGTSSARITVEQQLSRNLTLTYATNVNESAQQLIQLQWNLTQNVSVVATRDETGVYSTVFKIRRRYK